MIKFELSEQMVNVIAQALGNAPYNVAAPVVAEMQKQINEQQVPMNGKQDEIRMTNGT